jgi:Domain of unknown function (DUF4386)
MTTAASRPLPSWSAPPPPAAGGTDPDVRRAGRTAGIGLLAMALLAGLGYAVAIQGLVTPDDASRTAADVLASEGLFRWGVVAMIAVAVLDVVVAWALYRVFAVVDARLALLAAVVRWVYAAVLLVAVGHLAGAVDLLTGARGPADLGATQSHSQALLEIGEFQAVWNAGLVLFAAHLVLLGLLAYRSGFAPRWLGLLLLLAGLGYAVDGVAAVLSGGSWPTVAQFTFLGEVLLAFWLLVHAGRHRAGRSRPAAAGDA